MKVAIYARASAPTAGTPNMQPHDLRAWAKRMDYEAVEYVEKESSVKRRRLSLEAEYAQASMIEDSKPELCKGTPTLHTL